MSGTKVLADTNTIINLSEGIGNVVPFLKDKDVYMSIITEIELLGWYNISARDVQYFQSIFEACYIIELIPQIKNIAIQIKQENRIKLPDAIIAATAIFLEIPLLTFNLGFAKIKKLDLILIKK